MITYIAPLGSLVELQYNRPPKPYANYEGPSSRSLKHTFKRNPHRNLTPIIIKGPTLAN